MKKFLAWIALVPFLSIAYTSTDLSNATFLAQKGIITQQSSETGYRLDDKITRAEVIGIALKIKGTTLPEDYKCKKYFTDTVNQDWVCRAIELASDNELISRGNTKARPQDSITRAEAFSILFKASGITPTKEYGTFVSKDLDATQWQKDLFVKVRNSEIEIPGTQYLTSSSPETPYKFFPNRLATRADVFGFGSKILEGGTPSTSETQVSVNTITVVDGDTINYGDLKIRMIGLDAPESSTSRYGYIECFGPQASAYLKTLLKDAQEISIEKDPTQGETDKYGRTLAYVFYNGINLNTKMILDGYAFEYTYDKAYKYQSDNKNAELTAKNAGLGLWSTSTCGGDRKKGTQAGTIPTTPSTSSYSCGSKTYCSEMTTCEEAKYYLNSCGLSRLDADKDGIPCESICN